MLQSAFTWTCLDIYLAFMCRNMQLAFHGELSIIHFAVIMVLSIFKAGTCTCIQLVYLFSLCASLGCCFSIHSCFFFFLFWKSTNSSNSRYEIILLKVTPIKLIPIMYHFWHHLSSRKHCCSTELQTEHSCSSSPFQVVTLINKS